MSAVIDGLVPEAVWRNFAALCARPHGSGNERAVADYVLSRAERLGLPARRDDVGNVVVSRPASPGLSDRPGVVLQGHLDMVCEKNASCDHDFATDPIRLVRDGDWITARETTLGADNGIGVAMALAVMEDAGLALPSMEFLFTVDEETGLKGALGLGEEFVRGRLLLNLDSEDEGAVYIGCAGGRNTVLRLPIERKVAEGGRAFRVLVEGLRGGHSGLDIHEGRGNAVLLLARFLEGFGGELALSAISGGRMHNAIPREARAVVVVRDGRDPAAAAAAFQETVRSELRAADPGACVRTEEAPLPPTVLSGPCARRLLGFLRAAPNGVAAMSQALPELVETSSNVATIAATEEEVEVLTSQRSALASGLADITSRVEAAGRLAGFRIDRDSAYPAWPPDPDSPLLALFRRVHVRLRGEEPEVKAVHAGLECGIIGKRYPGMDMISFGPDIRGAHSPDERVHVESVARVHGLLLEVLAEIAGPAGGGGGS